MLGPPLLSLMAGECTCRRVLSVSCRMNSNAWQYAGADGLDPPLQPAKALRVQHWTSSDQDWGQADVTCLLFTGLARTFISQACSCICLPVFQSSRKGSRSPYSCPHNLITLHPLIQHINFYIACRFPLCLYSNASFVQFVHLLLAICFLAAGVKGCVLQQH